MAEAKSIDLDFGDKKLIKEALCTLVVKGEVSAADLDSYATAMVRAFDSINLH